MKNTVSMTVQEGPRGEEQRGEMQPIVRNVLKSEEGVWKKRERLREREEW